MLLVGFFTLDKQITLPREETEMGTGSFFNRDNARLDIFSLRDESLESDNRPDPDVLAQEIVEDLEAALMCLPYLNYSS